MRTGGLLCAIHQPNFLPRLTTLAKIYASDVWVVLDNVQFTARDYQHRTMLAGFHRADRPQWLTLPVHRPAGRSTRIDGVLLCDAQRSARRVNQLVRQHYGRTDHWPDIEGILESFLPLISDGARLADVAEASTRAVLRRVGWHGRIVRSSTFDTSEDRSTRLADLTRAVGATTYLCGPSGAGYLDRSAFSEFGLGVEYFEPATPDTVGFDRRLGLAHWLASKGMVRLMNTLSGIKEGLRIT